jgi:hypothetical protein
MVRMFEDIGTAVSFREEPPNARDPRLRRGCPEPPNDLVCLRDLRVSVVKNPA